MEALTRLVSESLARYGLDRPVDYRRLQWSRWFRCESLHSLLFIPSKPGIFAIAEEIVDLGTPQVGTAPHESLPRAQSRGPAAQSSASPWTEISLKDDTDREGHDFSSASAGQTSLAAFAAEATPVRGKRMLAVLQFGEDDDMAFVLDRMLSRQNPMQARLLSGRCFLRYVVIEEESQRLSICNALNQWLVSSGEKASGVGAHFASSLELTVARTCPERESKEPSPTNADDIPAPQPELDLRRVSETISPAQLSPQPFPSGF